MELKSWKGIKLYTIGHSTRTLDEFAAMLRSFDIRVLADIRTIPRSRHNPQFNGDSIGPALLSQGLLYVHLSRLGGLRHARKGSLNTGWRNASFRGFADYMLTEEFETGLAEVHDLAVKSNVSLMCAEAVPWRCHRSLVADALSARGAQVEHIMGLSDSFLHKMTAFSRVQGMRVTYPGEEAANG